jgi:crossover junction endodeoxyribonuclease RusA
VIEFRVFGEPAPQGSKKSIGNNRFVETSKKLAPWRKAVKDAATGFVVEDLDAPIFVDVAFYLPKPKTVKREYPVVKPDADKLLRAVYDGITSAGVWRDDAMIIGGSFRKFYASDTQPMGANIRIYHL